MMQKEVIIACSNDIAAIGLDGEPFVLKELEIMHENAGIEFNSNDVEIFKEYIKISDKIHRHDIVESIYQKLEAIVEVKLERSEAQKLIEFSRKANIHDKNFLEYVFQLFDGVMIYPSGSSLIW